MYEFKQQCPDADINPFLQKSSQFFQDYIARGLKSIDAEKRMNREPDVDINKVEVEDKDSGLYMQKLRAWQAKAGWNNIPAAATRPTPLSPPQQPVEPEPLPVRQTQLVCLFFINLFLTITVLTSYLDGVFIISFVSLSSFSIILSYIFFSHTSFQSLKHFLCSSLY